MTAVRGPLGKESAPGPKERSKHWTGSEFLSEWGLVIVLALIPALPLLLGNGLVNTRAGGDSPFLLVRVEQLVLNLRAGVFPARWMPHAAYGLGYPFFNFYASLPYYLAALLKLAGAGYIWAIKLTQALGFVLAAVALYALCREAGHGRASSLFTALVYSCAPFHMVNIYVRGDSLSEFYAFVFFPLILWALLHLQEQLQKGFCSPYSFAAMALSYAGLTLTHNISALIFTPFILLYALWLAWNSYNKVKCISTSFAALATGALLSAWFWLPALAETRYVHLEEMTTGYFHYALHFRSLDLVQRSLIFDYIITADKQPFRMGLVQAMLAAVGTIVIMIKWIRQRRVDPQSAFGVFLLALSTWMITPLSRPLWDHLPLLPMVQFPWRFLSLQALATSLVAAYLIPERSRQKTWMTILLSVLVLFSALWGLHPERLVIEESDITTERLMLYEYFTANVGTTIRNDYLPRWVDPRPFTSEAFWQGGSKPAPLALEGQIASANLVALTPASERWMIEVASPQALLAFHTYYYPSWQALVDGQRVQVEALSGLGYTGLRLSQGTHEVFLYLGRTRVQLIAEALSAAMAVALIAITARGSRRNWRIIGILAAVCGIAVLLVARQRSDKITIENHTTTMPDIAASRQWDLSMDFDRIPYLHHNPDGIRFGKAVRLLSYELSALELSAGEVLTATTHWCSTQDTSLQIRMAIASPAQHLFGVPQMVAFAEEPLVGNKVIHTLPIPQSTMRGVYLLSVQVVGPEGEIRPVNVRGETLGTTYLLPVRIHNWIMPSTDEPVLHRFSEGIVLSKVQASQNTRGALEVMLTWQALAAPPQNYKIAFRLKDPSGWDVARLDTQPGYGFYPTSMWRPGELVHDRYTLSLDDGTPPGASYRLYVALYESASLRPLGTATIPNVVVVSPTIRHDYPVLHEFSPGIALSEAQLSAQEVEQGARLTISLKWAAMNRVGQDYNYRVVLRDTAGTIVHQEILPLVSGYATSLWPRDAIIASRCVLQLDRQLPVGEYVVNIAIVETRSGKEVDSFALPTTIRVTEAPRNFVIPQMQTSVGASLGGQVRLLGYDLQRTENELVLTLHWQAMSAMSTDYKVFVHLLDPATDTIVTQQDILAGGEGYPTTRWVPEEVVSSRVVLPLEGVSTGSYHLAVGLYDAAGRLPIVAPAEFVVSADRLLLREIIQP